MAATFLSDSSSPHKYTPSFLTQLQTEWNEFMLEISHSTPNEIIPGDVAEAQQPVQNIQGLIDPLNQLTISSGSNIVIPIPINTLKKLFSPTKLNVDDVFKTEFFNDVKENHQLSKEESKELQKLLFPDFESSNEISDFPSPSLPFNFRQSAPPRLISKKNKKQLSQKKNDVLRILSCFNNDKDENLLQKTHFPVIDESISLRIQSQKTVNYENQPTSNGNNIVKKINKRIPDEEAGSSNKETTGLVLSIRDTQSKKISGSSYNEHTLSKKTKSKNIQISVQSVPKKFKNKDIPSTSQTRSRNTIQEKIAVNQEEKQYSTVYDLELSEGGDSSSSLFYTIKSSRKNVKPTIVCTYFSQIELTKIYQAINKLGHFEIENSVSSRTTHLICGSSNKTINLCKAVARGCWVLDKKWVTMSAKENRWLFEERFEKKQICPAVKENRLKRQTFGSDYACEVFSESGSIFVSKSCVQPNIKDIKELIVLGGGKLEEKPEKASKIIGSMSKRKYIKEVWVLNCILQGYIVDVNKYIRQK